MVRGFPRNASSKLWLRRDWVIPSTGLPPRLVCADAPCTAPRKAQIRRAVAHDRATCLHRIARIPSLCILDTARPNCASGVYAVPDGTRNSLFSISRHCRAGLQIVPSLRDWASPVGHRDILPPAYCNTKLHCTPERVPSKDRLCYRVRVVVEEAWI